MKAVGEGDAGETVILLVGTTKGLFHLTSDDREIWQVAGPCCDGWPINHAIGARGRLWAAGGNDCFGAGVWRSDDGGESRARCNRRSNAGTTGAHRHADGTAHGDSDEVGHCVHNMVRAPGEGDLLCQQNHQGVWRSRDGARSWDEITHGLPSNFGFPIAVHPSDPQVIWTLPLNSDWGGRFPPDASAAVWKSTDGGETWAKKQAGLPARDCFFTVLRQAMSTDHEAPTGVYFDTNSGSVFASTDAGESWAEIARHLPTALCVEVAARV